MRRRWLDTVHLGVLIALACLAVACDGGGSPDGGQDGDGDGGQCPVLCSSNEECCSTGCGGGCIDGFCMSGGDCRSGCNYECDKASGEICDQSTTCCVPGTPPPICLVDCNCYSGEVCDLGACVPACGRDADCAAGLACTEDHRCRPGGCQTREDCVPLGGCRRCLDQQCVAESWPCAGDADCCVGRRCNFRTCVPLPTPCATDADCADADFPRCVGSTCQPEPNECVSDADCTEGEVCRNRECVPP